MCSDCGTRRLASTCGNAPLNTTPSSGDHENDDNDDDDDGYDHDNDDYVIIMIIARTCGNALLSTTPFSGAVVVMIIMVMTVMMIMMVMMLGNGSSYLYHYQVPLLLAFITMCFRLRAPVKYILLSFFYINHIIYSRLRAPVKGPNARQNFFRMGSRFRFRSDWFKIAFKFKVLAMFHKSCEQSVSSAGSHKRYHLFSGRTEFQHTVARPARRTVSFERRPSQRYLCGIC